MIKEEKRYRVDEKLKERVNDFRMALVGKDPDGERQIVDFDEWVRDYVLSFESDPYYPGAKRMLLSYGGPSDFFEFFRDGRIRYYYGSDYGPDSREVTGDDLLILMDVQDRLRI